MFGRRMDDVGNLLDGRVNIFRKLFISVVFCLCLEVKMKGEKGTKLEGSRDATSGDGYLIYVIDG